ncbi:hypothetical protein DL98DRAFT_435599, partial [Cadophora sp. DSE1049]
IDRFVINKCYTIKQSRPDFRPKIKEAGAVLKERGKQIIYLIAILSPGSKAEFFKIIQMPLV